MQEILNEIRNFIMEYADSLLQVVAWFTQLGIGTIIATSIIAIFILLTRKKRFVALWPVFTITFGVIISFVLGWFATRLLPTTITGIFVVDDMPGGQAIPYLVVSSILGIVLFQNGLTEIPIGHVGVMTFLGKRIPRVVLGEGYHLILSSPVMEIRETTGENGAKNPVDMRERTLEIPEVKIIAGGERDEAGKGEGDIGIASIKLDSTLQYRVVDPLLFLSVDLGEMKGALKDRTLDVTRREAAKGSLEAILRDSGDISIALIHDLKGEERDGSGNWVKSKKIKETPEIKSTIDRWGVEAIRVNITSINVEDELTKKALEATVRERLEKRAETIEAENLVNNTQMIAEALGISNEEAVILLQRERNKGKHIIISGGGGEEGTGAFEKIIAAIASRD